MTWKLIKALVRRIKAWYRLRNHINHLITKIEFEIREIEKNSKGDINRWFISELYRRKEEYIGLLNDMDRTDYTRNCEQENDL